PERLGPFRARGHDAFDARVLFGSQFQFVVHPAEQFLVSELPGISGARRGSKGTVLVAGPEFAMQCPQRGHHKDTAGHNSGNENNQGGEDDLPGIHQASVSALLSTAANNVCSTSCESVSVLPEAD